jgi:endo-1,4-beta-D-glucanase Y
MTAANKVGLLLLLSAFLSYARAECDWPAWQRFKQDYITEQGRIIDPSSAEKITTSEGQSYGLFFALVANDKPTFDRLLNWTEDNLAHGDLTAALPGWLWGKGADGSWKLLDGNSASDADLWIAYSLLEAGRLWQDRRYQILAASLIKRIGREEIVHADGLGNVLLPGKIGFVGAQSWKLNPSYQPPQILARFADYSAPWNDMQKTNYRLLQESAPKGFSPNWILWNHNQRWSYDADVKDLGSYDAIRVYLWVGMMADDDPHKSAMMTQLNPMAEWVANHGLPPETVATERGEATGEGPVGFSAALLPFLQHSNALEQQRKRVNDNPPGADAYYGSVLTLFGQGWDQQRYRFDVSGKLLPDWRKECVTSQ